MVGLARVGMALGWVAALMGAAWAAEEPAPKILTLDQVPAPVRATIEQQAPGAKIEAIFPTQEGGQTVYLAAATAEKKQMTLRVAADGKLLQKASHEELTLDTAPPAIKEIVLKEGAGAQIKEFARIVQDRKVMYVAVLQGDGKEINLLLDGEGKVMHKDVEENLTLDQVPAPVKETILKETAGAKVERIAPVRDEAKTLYLVDAQADEKSITLKVDADGKLLAKDVQEVVTLDQVPAPVKETIEKEAKGGKVEEIERTTRDGKTVYGVQLDVGGKNVELTVDPEGKIIMKKEGEQEEPEEKGAKGEKEEK